MDECLCRRDCDYESPGHLTVDQHSVIRRVCTTCGKEEILEASLVWTEPEVLGRVEPKTTEGNQK